MRQQKFETALKAIVERVGQTRRDIDAENGVTFEELALTREKSLNDIEKLAEEALARD